MHGFFDSTQRMLKNKERKFILVACSVETQVSVDRGPGTTLTVLGMSDAAGQCSARGASLAQIRAFGTNYGSRTNRTSRYADVKVGAWIENQSSGCSQASIDLTRGSILAPNSLAAFSYLDHGDLFTLRPYLEFDLRPLPAADDHAGRQA